MALWNKILKRDIKSRENETKDAFHKEQEPHKNEAVRDVTGNSGSAVASFYGTVVRPHITEKSSNQKIHRVYTFVASPDTNKIKIKRAVEARYNVRVESVRIINMPAKKRTRGKNIGWKAGLRKALVALKEGETIEIQ